MLMVGHGTGHPELPPRLTGRSDLATHPRAAFAARVRDHPKVVGYPVRRYRALAVISQGIGGLTELSFELEPGHRGQGAASTLIRGELTAIPSGQLVLAAVNLSARDKWRVCRHRRARRRLCKRRMAILYSVKGNGWPRGRSPM
jgi:hypothetical protein